MTPEGRRAEAERLAGPHKEGSPFLANCKTIRVAYADGIPMSQPMKCTLSR
jgi:hypothetical protein